MITRLQTQRYPQTKWVRRTRRPRGTPARREDTPDGIHGAHGARGLGPTRRASTVRGVPRRGSGGGEGTGKGQRRGRFGGGPPEPRRGADGEGDRGPVALEPPPRLVWRHFPPRESGRAADGVISPRKAKQFGGYALGVWRGGRRIDHRW